MNLINHDIEYEKRLIEVLGYNLEKSSNANVWNITDSDGKKAGFIEYKKIYNKNKKLNLPAAYAYIMIIDNNDISYKNLRRITDKNGNLITDIDFFYEFDIKRKNKNSDHVVIGLGKYPFLELWSNDYGHMCFRLDFKGLYLNYMSKTNNFNVEETLILNADEENAYNYLKEYEYVISYCDKNIDITDETAKGVRTREISGVSSIDEQGSNLLISEKSWINHKIRIDRKSIVTGSVEDMIIKHRVGIESFEHFRYLINKILPFKEEVIATLLKEQGGNKNVTEIFLPDLNIEKLNKGIQKVK